MSGAEHTTSLSDPPSTNNKTDAAFNRPTVSEPQEKAPQYSATSIASSNAGNLPQVIPPAVLNTLRRTTPILPPPSASNNNSAPLSNGQQTHLRNKKDVNGDDDRECSVVKTVLLCSAFGGFLVCILDGLLWLMAWKLGSSPSEQLGSQVPSFLLSNKWYGVILCCGLGMTVCSTLLLWRVKPLLRTRSASSLAILVAFLWFSAMVLFFSVFAGLPLLTALKSESPAPNTTVANNAPTTLDALNAAASRQNNLTPPMPQDNPGLSASNPSRPTSSGASSPLLPTNTSIQGSLPASQQLVNAQSATLLAPNLPPSQPTGHDQQAQSGLGGKAGPPPTASAFGAFVPAPSRPTGVSTPQPTLSAPNTQPMQQLPSAPSTTNQQQQSIDTQGPSMAIDQSGSQPLARQLRKRQKVMQQQYPLNHGQDAFQQLQHHQLMPPYVMMQGQSPESVPPFYQHPQQQQRQSPQAMDGQNYQPPLLPQFYNPNNHQPQMMSFSGTNFDGNQRQPAGRPRRQQTVFG